MNKRCVKGIGLHLNLTYVVWWDRFVHQRIESASKFYVKLTLNASIWEFFPVVLASYIRSSFFCMLWKAEVGFYNSMVGFDVDGILGTTISYWFPLFALWSLCDRADGGLLKDQYRCTVEPSGLRNESELWDGQLLHKILSFAAHCRWCFRSSKRDPQLFISW